MARAAEPLPTRPLGRTPSGIEIPLVAGPGHHRTASAIIPVSSEVQRSEEHTSELQSLMRISYAVFRLKQKKPYLTHKHHNIERHYYPQDICQILINYNTNTCK